MNATPYFWFEESWRIPHYYGRYLESYDVHPRMVFFFRMMFIFSLLLLAPSPLNRDRSMTLAENIDESGSFGRILV